MSAEKVFLQGGGNEWDLYTRSAKQLENMGKIAIRRLAEERALKLQKEREAQAKANVKPNVVVKSALGSKAKQAPHTTTPTVGATDTAIPRSAPQKRPMPSVPVKHANLPKPTAPIFNGAMKAIEATGDKQLIKEVIQGVDTDVPLPAPVAKMVLKTMNDLGIPADKSNDIVFHVSDPIDVLPEDVLPEATATSTGMLATNPVPTYICRIGTKDDIAKWLINHFPAHNTYVEPFIGGGAVYLHKNPKPKEAINDFNYDIAGGWKRLKETTPSETIREWNKDKSTRGFFKYLLNFGKTKLPPKTANVRLYIEQKLTREGQNTAKKAFGAIDEQLTKKGLPKKNAKATRPAVDWKKYLNGNSIRYVPKGTSKTDFLDLNTDKEVKFPATQGALLYALYREYANMMDEMKVGLKLKGGANGDEEEGDEEVIPDAELSRDGATVMRKLLEENGLPTVDNITDWLQKHTREVDNPDYSPPKEGEKEGKVGKKILEGITILDKLIYLKIKNCGGFSGGAIKDAEMIKVYNNTLTAGMPVKKIPVNEMINFLLTTGGGLSLYNKRLANTEVTRGDYYKLVEKWDSPNTFFFLDPPYQASGGYGNSEAFNFEAFVKSMNGIPDPMADHTHKNNPKIKGKILITINGGDKLLALFRKYARQSGIKWYGLKTYVRQGQQNNTTGKVGYRYEIFYGTYKFDDRAVDILDNSVFNNNWETEEDKAGGEAKQNGAIFIKSDGTDVDAKSFFASNPKAEDQFSNRNKEDSAYRAKEAPKEKPVKAKKAVAPVVEETAVPTTEIVETAPAPKAKRVYKRKPKATEEAPTLEPFQEGQGRPRGGGYLGNNGAIVKDMIGGAYSPNNPHHLGSTFAYSPPSMLEGNGYQSVQW